MLPIRTILVPTDFSVQAEGALQMACALARDHGARVILTHVMPYPAAAYVEIAPAIDWGEQARQLEIRLRAIQPTDAAIEWEHRFCLGDPPTEIVALAALVRADLIVMGTHGRRGLDRVLMGSVAESVLRRAPCAVMTLKTPPQAVKTSRSPTAEPACV
jgi:nucleotide-binding universal stress UspA family protein